MTFAVTVSFETSVEEHDEALRLLNEYIGDFLAHQPGFIASFLTEKEDRTGFLHFARWRQESDFRAFGEKAQSHPLLPALRRFKPKASFYQVAHEYVGDAEEGA